MDAQIVTCLQKRLESHSRIAHAALRLRQAHLVGVAGSGMRAMADVLTGWGCRVSGSDLSIASMHAATDNGQRLFQGHAAEHLPSETDVVFYSDAVPADNPELRRAAELGIPAVSYFQMLGQLSAARHTLAVAGTHGKSTTTGMAAHVLVEAGRDPTVFCGAAPLGKGSGGHAGRNDLLLVEACEYRENFLHLRPRQAVILGIEPDHFDYYHTLEQLEGAFARFAAAVPPDGLLLARHDCASTRRATQGLACRVETFGLDPAADWSAQELRDENGFFRFDIVHRGQRQCEVRLRVPGLHNVLNALAAAALACENGVSADRVAAALGSFAGLHRRLELRGEWHGVALIDDYAHHPSEIRAALAAVRGQFPHRRVWCVVQPHQVSRTERLLDELAASLQNADKVLVAEICRAREGEPRPGEVTPDDLARRVRAGGADVLAPHAADDIRPTLETLLSPGDVLVIMGAGDTTPLWPNGSLHQKVYHGSPDRS